MYKNQCVKISLSCLSHWQLTGVFWSPLFDNWLQWSNQLHLLKAGREGGFHTISKSKMISRRQEGDA